MRLSQEAWAMIRKLLKPNTAISCVYNGKPRTGTIENVGEGPQGPFIGVNTPDGFRNFSVGKIQDFVTKD